jgi:hypothetical protein
MSSILIDVVKFNPLDSVVRNAFAHEGEVRPF